MGDKAWVGGTLTKRSEYRTHRGLCPQCFVLSPLAWVVPTHTCLPHLFLKQANKNNKRVLWWSIQCKCTKVNETSPFAAELLGRIPTPKVRLFACVFSLFCCVIFLKRSSCCFVLLAVVRCCSLENAVSAWKSVLEFQAWKLSMAGVHRITIGEAQNENTPKGKVLPGQNDVQDSKYPLRISYTKLLVFVLKINDDSSRALNLDWLLLTLRQMVSTHPDFAELIWTSCFISTDLSHWIVVAVRNRKSSVLLCTKVSSCMCRTKTSQKSHQATQTDIETHKHTSTHRERVKKIYIIEKMFCKVVQVHQMEKNLEMSGEKTLKMNDSDSKWLTHIKFAFANLFFKNILSSRKPIKIFISFACDAPKNTSSSKLNFDSCFTKRLSSIAESRPAAFVVGQADLRGFI